MTFVVTPNVVYLNQAGGAGTGTQVSPYNTVANAKTGAGTANTRMIFLLTNTAFDANASGYVFIGWGPQIVTVTSASTAHLFANTLFREVTMSGQFETTTPSGVVYAEDCHLSSTRGRYHARRCIVSGTFEPVVHVVMRDCHFGLDSSGTACTIDLSNCTSLVLFNCTGRVRFTNRNSVTGSYFIRGGGGTIELASSLVQWSTMVVSGNWQITERSHAASAPLTDYSSGTRAAVTRGMLQALHRGSAEATFTLSGAHDHVDTTLAVVSATGAAVGDLLVSHRTGEVMQITAAGNPITVTRGALGSVAQSMATGELLYQLYTIFQIGADVAAIVIGASSILSTLSSISSFLVAMDGKIDTVDANVDQLLLDVATVDGKADVIDANVDQLLLDVAGVDAAVAAVDTVVDGIATDLAALISTVSGIDADVDAIAVELTRNAGRMHAVLAALRSHVTTVATGISDSDTSLDVTASGATAPTVYAANLRTGELFSITGVASNTWTITRGEFGTTAAAMLAGDFVLPLTELYTILALHTSSLLSIASDVSDLSSIGSEVTLTRQNTESALDMLRVLLLTKAATLLTSAATYGAGDGTIELSDSSDVAVDDWLVDARTGELLLVTAVGPGANEVDVDRGQSGTTAGSILTGDPIFVLGTDPQRAASIVQQIVDLFIDDAETVVNGDSTRTVTIYEQDGTTVKNRVTISADGLNRTRNV